MSRLHHVSASQITTFRACKRLWAIEKVAEMARDKAGAGQGALDIGSETHAMLEDYLLTGHTPPVTHPHRTKFDAVVQYLPTPAPANPGLLVEYEFEFPVYPGGTNIVGAMDICLPPWRVGVMVDGAAEPVLVAGIDDHKTTSDLKYAKTPEELASNTQLIIYAYYLFRMKELCSWNLLPWEAWRLLWEEGLDRVRVRHNYIKTRNVVRKGQSVQVEAWLTWEKVAKEWAGIVSDVKEMEQLADALWDNVHAIQNDSAKIDYLIQLVEGDQNDGARCHMYNGCDHKGRCPEANSLVALTRGTTSFKLEPEYDNIFANAPQMEEKNMPNEMQDDLAARLMAKMSKKAEPVGVPAPKPAAAPVTPTTPPVENPGAKSPGELGLEGYKPGQKCNGRGWYKNEKTSGFIPVEKGHVCEECAKNVGQPQVTPPDAPPPETTAADVATVPPAGDNPISAALPEATAAVPAPKKRTRKSKAEKAAEELAAQQAAAQSTPTPAPTASTPEPAPAEPVAAQADQATVQTTITQAITEATDPDRVVSPMDQPGLVTPRQVAEVADQAAAVKYGAPGSILYVNCRPLSGPHAAEDPFAYDRWISKVLAAIRTETGVPHYKLLKFGAGHGALATIMERLFNELPAVVMVDSMRPEAQEFLDIAIPRAQIVIQGVR